MSLEENLYKAIVSLNYADDKAKQCVKICDEFAVGFAEWLLTYYYQEDGCWLRKHDVNYQIKYTTTELLEIYKQGL